ncbi:MAG: hypothetical protein AAF677_04110 [Pseudomonadota bacterium]
MEQAGTLQRRGGRYEFSFEELKLTVRGAHPEWVLTAAAEIIADTEKLRLQGKLDELSMLVEMGEADEMDVDDANYAVEGRFQALPQCSVVLGDTDYRWVSRQGRDPNQKRVPPVERVHRENAHLPGAD